MTTLNFNEDNGQYVATVTSSGNPMIFQVDRPTVAPKRDDIKLFGRIDNSMDWRPLDEYTTHSTRWDFLILNIPVSGLQIKMVSETPVTLAGYIE